MRNSWRLMIAAAALGVALVGAVTARAQEPPLTGAYGDASTGDPEVMAAARFAVGARGRRQGARISLVSVERAEVQVVAGLNYRLRMKVKVGGVPQEVTAVVYKNLRRQYSLTEWVAGQAAESTAPPARTIEDLVKALGEAYESKSLGSLDAERPYVGGIRISYNYPLDVGRYRNIVRVFKSFAAAERWLRSREISENLPNRSVKPLEGCSKGVCEYGEGNGTLHNQLYLYRVEYGLRKGRPYIKTIYLSESD